MSEKTEKIEKYPLTKVLISDRNTRQPKPTDPEVIELAQSITHVGQTTPAIGRPHPKKKGYIELAAGAKRRIALELNKAPTIDLIVREMDDDSLDIIILVENLQRTNPDPRAEAELIGKLQKRGLRTVAQISAHLGKPENWVSRRMKLLDVIPKARDLWERGKAWQHFTVDMMELIGSLPAETQGQAIRRAYQFSDVSTRKSLESKLSPYLYSLRGAPFDLNDPRFFVKNCGPGCATDSSKEKDLFDFKGGKGGACARCLNSSCFDSRMALWREVKYKELAGDEDLPIYSEDYLQEVRFGSRQVRPGRTHDLVSKECGNCDRVVLLTDNGNRMKIAWKPRRSSRSTTSDGKPKSPAAKRSEGITMLQGKRWLLVRQKLLTALKKASVTELTVPLDDLIAVLGLPFHVQNFGNEVKKPWEMLDSRANGFPPYKDSRRDSSKLVSREEALWPAMQVVLESLMPEPWKVSFAERFAETYLRIGALIQFDTPAAKKAADLEILPPKSWGKVDPHTLK